MPIVYLTPDDLSPAQTLAVLEFLNSVESAEEIATRVEIPGELDVGPRVGQRILDHRAQLPDGFTDLTQLMDVYLVGPERFTEIVASVLGIPLPGFSTESLDDMIGRAIAAQLHGAPVEAAAASADQYRISVQTPQSVPWLGQEITVTLKITSAANGKPVVNLPVSVESSDMWLSTQFGFETRAGKVISSRTATDGSIRLRLRRVFDERLTVDQFTALQEALRGLDSEAAAPRDMRAQLEQLVDLYEDLRNKNLRAAMDIVYHTSGRHLTENLNQQDHLYQWRFHSSLLRVYLDADAQPQLPAAAIVDATAAQVGIYHVSWKQWLMPWYQVYLERLADSDLQQSFRDAAARFDSEAGITAEILGQAYRFVAAQNGLLGEALGKQVIGKEIQHFLAREISNLPATDQRSMYPSLLLAGSSINTADTGTLALVNQTRADVEVELDERISETVQNNDEILSSIGALNSRVDRIDSQVVTQGQNFGELQLQVDNMRGDLDTLDGDVRNVQGNITEINSRIDLIDERTLTLDAGFTQLTTDFRQMELDFGQVRNDVKTLDASVERLDGNLRNIDNRVSGIDTGLQNVDSRVTSMDASVSRIDAQFSGISRDVATLNKTAVLKSDITRDSRGRLVDIKTRNLTRQ